MNAAADTQPQEQASGRLTDAQLREVMRLIKGANSVELKLTVPASAHRATIQGLPIDPVEAQPRQIYFFDTPDLQLFTGQASSSELDVSRAAEGDTVIKLRPVEPDDIPADLKNDASFNIEVDALPGRLRLLGVVQGSLNGTGRSATRSVARSGCPRSSRRRSGRSIATHAPAGLELDSLQALGPTFILKGRFDAQMGLDGKRGSALDGRRGMALSRRITHPRAVDQVPAQRSARCGRRDARIPRRQGRTNQRGAQETKTRTALEFYSKTLAGRDGVDGRRRPTRRCPRSERLAPRLRRRRRQLQRRRQSPRPLRKPPMSPKLRPQRWRASPRRPRHPTVRAPRPSVAARAKSAPRSAARRAPARS